MFAALHVIAVRATLAPPRHRLVWLISATDHHDHTVTLEQMEAGAAAGQGTYRAVCGHLVLVCAMATPPGPRCPSCDEQLLTTPPPKQRRWTAALRSVLGRHPEPRRAARQRPCQVPRCSDAYSCTLSCSTGSTRTDRRWSGSSAPAEYCG